MNRDQILELLDTYALPAFQRDNKEGGTLVATVRGARILGLFPRREGTSGNALWISSNVHEILSGSQKDWEGDGEGSVGGDRLWVSPERNFYYKEPSAFGGWFTPLEMDPGKYQETQNDESSVTYKNTFDLQDRLNEVSYSGVTMSRTLRMLENPLPDMPDNVGYVGVETVETLSLPSEGEKAPVICPWGLTQVCPPSQGAAGTVVIPTAKRANPIGYFGTIPSDRLRVQDDHVAFKIDAQRIFKLAVAPDDLAPSGPVSVAYLSPVFAEGPGAPRPKAGEWLLMLRETSDVARATSEAIDPSKVDPDGRRGVIQAYNNGPSGAPEYAKFGEIEVQYRPVRKQNGIWSSTAKTRLLAYQGAKDDILSVASRILGLKDIDLFA